MLRKILVLLTLTVTCSGCMKTSYSAGDFKIDLPEMPIAGKAVAAELKEVCTVNKCKNLNEWLNELYLFRAKYNVYKQELAK